MLIAGEVHTGLLRGRNPLDADQAAALVDLVAGEPVLRAERPRAYVCSPQRPVGVDCPLGAPPPARQVRGIGTVLQHAAITDGHVLQGTAYATLTPAAGSARRPWSHYLTRPGVVETVGRHAGADLADALARPVRPSGALDLGAIAGRAATVVQSAMPDDGRSRERLRLPRTRLRFVVRDDSGPPRFDTHGDDLRILRISAGAGTDPWVLTTFAEDVALHDWLLTSVMRLVERSAIGSLPRDETLRRLEPAVDHLLHLWLPAGRGGETTAELWEALERRADLGRQWVLLRDRIRDQFAVGAVAALSTALRR